ncbi:MAG TPA: triose-phosphate isomerase [Flavobacteriaceae bacterium]|nr:triose-phosphate isomerase [Flavobacteriaceae bacterium]
MRKKIVAANWKMNKDLAEANEFLSNLMQFVPSTDVEVLLAPSYTNLWHAYETTRDFPVEIIAQNVHEKPSGAYTGEVSASMLKSIGVNRAIIGHSERRQFFNETDEIVAQKVNILLQNDMKLICCIGENLQERNANKHFSVIKNQLKNGLFHLHDSDWSSVVIAYEPVWAIGTGQTATPEQAQEMHAFIRNTISEHYNDSLAAQVSILYGGSVKPQNAETLFTNPDVDGALVGGASLEVNHFIEIIQAL